MTALVFHSSTLGVTEYDASFAGLTEDFECTVSGLYRVGGANDAGTTFVSRFTVGLNADNQSMKRVPITAHITAESAGKMSCTVATVASSYSYAEEFKTGNIRRFRFGRGIRDNYLGFSFYNPDGVAFRVDRLELNIQNSVQRKV